MKLADMLKTNTATFKAPQRFPAGNYVVVITGYDMLPFHWKKSGLNGLAYVPTIRPVSCVELDDESNPDLQQEQEAALAAYGDWTAKEFQFSHTSKETNAKMAGVAEINFPLIECDDSGQPVGILDKHAWRFSYVRTTAPKRASSLTCWGWTTPTVRNSAPSWRTPWARSLC